MTFYDWMRLIILAMPTIIVVAGGVALWRGGRMRHAPRHVRPYGYARHRLVVR